MSYKYDIFISYSHKGNVPEWVQNHFHPELEKCLQDEMTTDPRVFIDKSEIAVGDTWRDRLSEALLRSKMMVAIWSPPYFSSEWCVIEWKTILERETILGLATPENPSGLLYPIVFRDGVHFPDDARNRQQQRDLSKWAISRPQFRDSLDYIPFAKAIQEIATDLANRLLNVPDWDAGWPVETKPVMPSLPTASVPRLS